MLYANDRKDVIVRISKFKDDILIMNDSIYLQSFQKE